MNLLPYLLAMLAGLALHYIAPFIPFLEPVLAPVALVVIVLFAIVIIVQALLQLFRNRTTL